MQRSFLSDIGDQNYCTFGLCYQKDKPTNQQEEYFHRNCSHSKFSVVVVVVVVVVGHVSKQSCFGKR